MRRFELVAILVLARCAVSHADEVDSLVSKTTIDASLTLSQSTYSDSWAGGDAGNLA